MLTAVDKQWLERAWDDLSPRKRSARRVASHAFNLSVQYRDACIEIAAENMVEAVHAECLMCLVPLVENVAALHQQAFTMPEQFTPVEIASTVAIWLAGIQWYYREEAGIEQVLCRATEDDADSWIKRREPQQLQLF